ncbi:MAG: hypothetical protein ACK4RZ_01610 [Paracoccaceae bacterium]
MPYSHPFLTGLDVAEVIAHPTDDVAKVYKSVVNMTHRNLWLVPHPKPDRPKVKAFTPGDCVVAAAMLRLWNAGFQASEGLEAAVLRLNNWYLTDEFPDWLPGDPDPVSPVDPDKPTSPASFILQDFCETDAGWTLRVDSRRNRVTGKFRSVATLWRGEGDSTVALGNGSPCLADEELQCGLVVVLDEILAQVASRMTHKLEAR